MPLTKAYGITLGWPLAAGRVIAFPTPAPSPTPTPTDFQANNADQLQAIMQLGGATLSGKTIGLNPGNYGAVSFTAPTDNADPITILGTNQNNKPQFTKLDIADGNKLVIDGISIVYDNSLGSNYQPFDEFYLLAANGVTGIRVTNSYFNSNSGGDGILARRKRFGGIRTVNCTAVEIDNNEISYVRDGIASNGNNIVGASINCHHNYIHHYVEDGLTGLSQDWIFRYNRLTWAQGIYGQGYNVASTTGTISVGDLLVTNPGPNQKLLLVREFGGTTIGGIHNSFRYPTPGEVYTSQSGATVTLGTAINGSGTPGFYDDVHGDAFQPLINNATRAYTVVCEYNEIYLSTLPDSSSLDGEQQTQGILIQKNSGTINWASVTARYNVVSGTMPIAINVLWADTLVMEYNLVIQPQVSTFATTMDVRNSGSVGGIVANYNVGESLTSSGLFGAAIVEGGGNSGIKAYGNVELSLTEATTVLTAPFTYPQSRTGLAPLAGSKVEAAVNGEAGALDPTGSHRPYVAPPALRVLDSATTNTPTVAAQANSNTMAYTAPAGSQRRLVVCVASASSDNSSTSITSVTWGGVALTKVVEHTSGTTINEVAAIFELPEASFPTGATGNIVATSNGNTGTTVVMIQAQTLNASPTAASATGIARGSSTTGGGISGTITTTAPGSAVVAFHSISVNSTGQNYTAGVINALGGRVTSSAIARSARTGYGFDQSAGLKTITTAAINTRVTLVLASWTP